MSISDAHDVLFVVIPERYCQDLLHVNPPLQHLGHLPFLWSLFHLFSSDQVHRLWGQDQVPLDSLKNSRKYVHECFFSSFLSVVKTQEQASH